MYVVRVCVCFDRVDYVQLVYCAPLVHACVRVCASERAFERAISSFVFKSAFYCFIIVFVLGGFWGVLFFLAAAVQ